MPLQTFRISKIDGTDTLSSSQQQVDQRTLVFNSVEEFVNHHCEDLDKRRYIKKVGEQLLLRRHTIFRSLLQQMAPRQ